MTHSLKEAVALHRALPPEGWLALREAGISDDVTHSRLVGWDGERITIPVFSHDRQVVAIERADFDDEGLLVVEPDPSAPVRLFGAPAFHTEPTSVIITQGVAEALVLQSQRFNVVAGTGAGLSLPNDVAELFRPVREVFICFKRGVEGESAAAWLTREIPEAMLVALPVEDGEGIAQFFARENRTRDEFVRYLAEAS
ncbi:MAG TPA: hypothetical protein VIV65_09420 [Gemmatimonadaceae bacterium]|jgi:hypothetical protein